MYAMRRRQCARPTPVFLLSSPIASGPLYTPSADDIAPPAVPGGRGYFPVGDVKYAALTEGESFPFRTTSFVEARADVVCRPRKLEQLKSELVCTEA